MLLKLLNLIKQYKLFLYLIFVLRYPVGKDDQQISKILAQYENDLQFCLECFVSVHNNGIEDDDIKNCDNFIRNKLIFNDDNEISFVGTFNNLFGVKPIQYAKLIDDYDEEQKENNDKSAINKDKIKNTKNVVIKYLGDSEKFNYILGGICNTYNESSQQLLSSCLNQVISNTEENLKILRQLFFNKNRFDGLKFCPENHIEEFIDDIFLSASSFTDKSLLNIWIHLIVNVQPLLLPYLNLNFHHFPTPKLYKSCGFTIFQSYEGKPLINFYSNSNTRITFYEKLQITAQLLEAVLKFTNGFHGYRIYLTDLNYDNIVYDEYSKRISFIDLDNLIIVDSSNHLMQSRPKRSMKNDRTTNTGNGSTTKTTTFNDDDDWSATFHIHRHDIIECNGCFAYVPSEICLSYKSDLNLFAVCQLLREDLYGNYENGFLHPIPVVIQNTYPKFLELLNECVDCKQEKDCVNRFESAKNLLNIINEILRT